MKKVRDYVREHQLITQGDRVIIGLSGGADSVCLLFVLLELQKELDFTLTAVHVNHQLRGQEALRDQNYVENLCKSLDVPLKIENAAVAEVAKKNKMGIEEAGRMVRYQTFETYAGKIGANKIALAHHQNDQAETMIYHLARGTDLTGLASIRPRRGMYIRPLLCMNRKEIEDYLEKNHLEYVTDSSNLEDHYIRNRVRHHVVEYLEEQVNEQAVAHMCETAQAMGELYEYLSAEAVRKLNQYGVVKAGGIYLKQTLFSEPKVMAGYVIRETIAQISGSLKDVTREHINQIQLLAGRSVGKQVHLPYDLFAKKEYEGIWIGKKESAFYENKIADGTCGEKEAGRHLPVLEINQTFQMKWNGYEIIGCAEPWNPQEIPEKKYTKWFDYDKIKSTLMIRYRHTGDQIRINDQGGRKKLKDYFIDVKIPKEQRDSVPLLCCDQDVLWVVGYRISEAYKVTESTKNILKIQMRGGIDHE